jgi:uncharacterized protein GlcG (DUF336 family)
MGYSAPPQRRRIFDNIMTALRNPTGERTMRIHGLIALCIGSVVAFAGAAPAQQPSPPPSPAPAAEYGPPITNEQAKAVAGAALAEAKKNNWRMALAIVGPAGELVYFEKMDGAQLASTDLSLGKARTAVMFRRASKTFADQAAAGNTSFLTFPEMPGLRAPVASEGGLPIVVSGKIVGAVGVSGGTGQNDGVTAAAGAGALK